MIEVLGKHFKAKGVTLAKTIRIAAHNVMPGVKSDEGKGDDWPDIRRRILAADILIFGTPIWMGQAGSVAKRVLERMDAFLDETDEAGRMPSYSKVAVAAIVGNEDGAHPRSRRFTSGFTPPTMSRASRWQLSCSAARRTGADLVDTILTPQHPADHGPHQAQDRQAVSIGIIVNELVSNACKYAYPAQASGEVRIGLHAVGDKHFRLTVEDDGQGMPPEKPADGTGIGSKLIKAMAQSLRASVTYVDGNPGLRAELNALR